MSTESYFLELKEYCNKPVILDYQIEEITYEFFNTKIKTNKWIDFTVWLKIHEKLEQILKQDDTTQNSLNYLDDFSSEEFLLSNNSVSILIVKDSLEKKFAKIFNMNPDEIQPFIIRIHINIMQENNNILKKSTHNANKNSPSIHMKKKEICDKVHHEYNPLSPRTTNSELNFPNENDFIPYKPSTKDEPKIETLENNVENDPYSPKPIDMLTGENSIESIAAESPDIFDEQGASNNVVVPKYKASPILNTSSESSKSIFDKIPETVTLRRKSQRSPQKRFVDIEQYRETRSKRRIEEVSIKQCNNREENKKALKTEELFGSDDSDIDILDIKPKRCDTIKKSKKNDRKSTKLERLKTGKKLFYPTDESDDTDKMKHKKSKVIRLDDGQDNLDGWLNASKIRSKHNKIISSKNINLSKQSVKVLTHETSKSKTVSSEYPTIIPVKKLTDEERRLKSEQHRKEINALNEFNNQVKQRMKPPINIDFKSLNHIPITTILKTFIQYKPLLDKHFHEYRSQKNRQVKIIEGLDHLALINIVEDNYQLEMLNCLKGTYEKPDDVPCYTELFMTLLLPEWILALFMKEYKLSREKAIQRLKDQEDAKICSQMDNSVFDFATLENM